MATTGTFDQGGFRIAFAPGGTTAGDMAAVANPTGEALIVTGCVVNLTTASSGASTVDVGIAANGTTSADNLIDGLSLATAGAFADLGTNGKRAKVWGATEYLTMSEASGDVTGAAGELIVQFLTR